MSKTETIFQNTLNDARCEIMFSGTNDLKPLTFLNVKYTDGKITKRTVGAVLDMCDDWVSGDTDRETRAAIEIVRKTCKVELLRLEGKEMFTVQCAITGDVMDEFPTFKKAAHQLLCFVHDDYENGNTAGTRPEDYYEVQNTATGETFNYSACREYLA